MTPLQGNECTHWPHPQGLLKEKPNISLKIFKPSSPKIFFKKLCHKKIETLSSDRQAFKSNVRKHKLAQLGLMENVGLYTQPILAEQERTRKAIESLQDNNNKHTEETTPKKQIVFQETFQIDFRNIDQDLPKSVRPVFSQDGFKIGKATLK